MAPQVASELARLSEENRRLREQVVAESAKPKLAVRVHEEPLSSERGWPFKIRLENIGSVAIEHLDIQAWIEGDVELTEREKGNKPVGIDSIVKVARLPQREDERVSEDRRLIKGVVDLLRPKEARIWGDGFVYFPAPGEYQIHMIVKAKNLPNPFDEKLTLSVVS